MNMGEMLSSLDSWDTAAVILLAFAGVFALVMYINVLIKDKSRVIQIKASRFYLILFLLFFLLALQRLKSGI